MNQNTNITKWLGLILMSLFVVVGILFLSLRNKLMSYYGNEVYTTLIYVYMVIFLIVALVIYLKKDRVTVSLKV